MCAVAEDGGSHMIRRITGIIIGVVAFLLVYWLTGLGTPSQPNLALALYLVTDQSTSQASSIHHTDDE